jgi:hypothetical protein
MMRSTPTSDVDAEQVRAGDSAASAQAPELSVLMITLLRGALHRDEDERLWAGLLRLQSQVRAQAGILLLELLIDEAEGYAFLKSRSEDPDDPITTQVPRLVARRPLSFAVSLMLALLRRKLAEFDAAGSETRLILSRDQLVEMLRLFLPEASNEARLVDQIDATINKVTELGFLRRLKTASTGRSPPAVGPFEVRRILKAYVDAQWLADFDARLQAYRSRGGAADETHADTRSESGRQERFDD